MLLYLFYGFYASISVHVNQWLPSGTLKKKLKKKLSARYTVHIRTYPFIKKNTMKPGYPLMI